MAESDSERSQTPLNSNQYASQPVMEWLRERVDKSLAGMKFGETVELIERLTRELRLAESARDYANDMLDKARSGHEVIPIDAQRLRRLEALLAMWLSYAIQGGDVPDVLASNNPVHMLIRDTRNAIRKPASSLGESNSAPELFDACNAFKDDSKQWQRIAVAIQAAEEEIERLTRELAQEKALRDEAERYAEDREQHTATVARGGEIIIAERDRLRAALAPLVNAAVARELPTDRHTRQGQAALSGSSPAPETESCPSVRVALEFLCHRVEDFCRITAGNLATGDLRSAAEQGRAALRSETESRHEWLPNAVGSFTCDCCGAVATSDPSAPCKGRDSATKAKEGHP